MADLMVIVGDIVHWNVSFIRVAQDWEVNGFEEFIRLLYSTHPSPLGTNRFWRNKAPPKAVFFAWTTTLGKILTTGNLRKRRVIIVN